MLKHVDRRPARKTLLIYAGGTIGMKNSAAGLVPDPNFIPRLQATLAEAGEPVTFSTHTCDPVIDSASATPADWQQLAEIIRDQRDQFANFVILHGTDTLAFTAAALAEMLRGLGKAVVITGAQIPLGETDSDALTNIRGALAFARLPELQQTAVFFHDRLLRADAVRKTDAQSFAAFDSPQQDWLGVLSAGEALLTAPAFAEETESAFLSGDWLGFRPHAVVMLLLTPDCPPVTFVPVLAAPDTRAAVFLSYGVGNFPARADLRDAIAAALARGVHLVNVSQCWRGAISGHTYAGGGARLGLLSGGTLTPEMAFVRLHCLLAERNDEPLSARWLRRLNA